MKRILLCLLGLIVFAGIFVLQFGQQVSSQSGRVSNVVNYPTSNTWSNSALGQQKSAFASQTNYYLSLGRPVCCFLSTQEQNIAIRKLKSNNIKVSFGYPDLAEYRGNFPTAKTINRKNRVLLIGPFVDESEALRILNKLPSILPRDEDTSFSLVTDSFGWKIGLYDILGFRIASRSPSQPAIDAMPAHILVSHRTIIANWVQSGWRPAVKDDALRGQEADVRTFIQGEINSIGHHPFYLSKDFNRDGKIDFAVVITNGSQYALAIFNGPFIASGTYVPVFYTRQFEQGDFLFWMTDRQFGHRFIVGPPASDSGYIIRPRGKAYVVE